MLKLNKCFAVAAKKKSGFTQIVTFGLGLVLSGMLTTTALADSITAGFMPTRGGSSFGVGYDISESQGNRYGIFYRSIPDNDEKNQNGESFIGGYYKGVVSFGKISFNGTLGLAYHTYEVNDEEKVNGFASSLGYGVYRIINPNIKVGIENMLFNSLSGDLEGRQRNFTLIGIEYKM